MEEKNFFILLIILIVISNLYLIIKINYLEKEKNNENFAVTDDVKTAINEIYKADIESIRTLSNCATQLNAGSLNISNLLTVTNGIYTKGGDAGGGGGTHFPWIDGINYIRGNTAHDGTLNVRDNLTVGNKLILPNNTQLSADPDWLRLQDSTNSSYKPLAVKDLWADAGTIYAGNIDAKGNIGAQGAITAGSVVSKGDIRVKGKFVFIPQEITIGYNFSGSFAGSVSVPSNTVCSKGWDNGIKVVVSGLYSIKFRVDFANNTKGGGNGGNTNYGKINMTGFYQSKGHSCEGDSYKIDLNPDGGGYNIEYKLYNNDTMYPGHFYVDCECAVADLFEITFSNNIEANTSFAYTLKKIY